MSFEGSKATNVWCWLWFLTVSLQTRLRHCPNLSQGGSYEGSKGVCWFNCSYFHRDKCQKCCQCGGALSENKWVSRLYCMLRLCITVCLHIILNFSRHYKYACRKAGEAAHPSFPLFYVPCNFKSDSMIRVINFINYNYVVEIKYPKTISLYFLLCNKLPYFD